MTSPLFSATSLGTDLRNRIVMAPMTRGRANADAVPQPIMATYYEQRADAGLIITEGTFVSQQGIGWVNAPGIFTDEQTAAWKPVTQAVHDKGGKIFVQLWHMGRVVHPDFQDGELPVAPSAIAADGYSHTPNGKQAYVEPRALDIDELPGIVDSYRAAAANAMEAGFDGVEIHGANGYLIDQFIRDSANQRTDEYGGSIENRWRLPLEVVHAVVDEIGAQRTAIRLSPVNAYNSMDDSDPVASYTYGASELSKLGLAYVHVLEARAGMMFNESAPSIHPHIRRELGDTPMMLNGGYDLDSAEAAIGRGEADAISFGALFLANPDLVSRLRNRSDEYNLGAFSTYYTNDEAGYTDYPALDPAMS